MQILQLTNKPPWPAKDGGAIAVLNLTKGLSMSGHKMTVLFMNTGKHHILYQDIPETVKEYADFRLAEVPAEISPAGAVLNLLFSKEPYNAIRFISNSFTLELAGLLKEKTFDVVQLEGLYLCPYIPVIRKYSAAKIAYRAHNIESEIWDRTATVTAGFKKWYFRDLASRIGNFERKWLNSYDLLVPITRRDGEMLNNMGNTKPMHVSPTGTDSESLVTAPVPTEFPSLFHIGSLEWTPNQEGLIWFLKNCWGPIIEKHPGLQFYIAGRHAPKWLTDKLKQPGITFLGEVEDAISFMKSKAVMIVPLLSGSGMRIKIIEGMAVGRAIVSTAIGAEGLQVTNLENILIADGAADFIQSIDSLIKDRSLYNHIGENAAFFIRENFDNLAIAKKLAAFYQSNLT